MCRSNTQLLSSPVKPPSSEKQGADDDNDNETFSPSFWSLACQVVPSQLLPQLSSSLLQALQWTATLILPFYIPPGHLIEGGFTRWWVRLTVFYLCSGCRYRPLCNFQAVLGLTLNVGWYSVVAYDMVVKGNDWGNIVYRNVAGLRNYTIDGSWSAEKLQLAPGAVACGLRMVSLFLDILLHPTLCAFFWYMAMRGHRQQRQTQHRQTQSLDQIASWSNLTIAFVLARLWSAVQNRKFHNDPFSFYYYGPDVYYLPPNQQEWFQAGYVGEAACIAVLVFYKLYLRLLPTGAVVDVVVRKSTVVVKEA